MSDCSNGGRNVYQRPRGRDVMRVHMDFDVHGQNMRPDWDYPFALNGRELKGISVDGVPWEPAGDAR